MRAVLHKDEHAASQWEISENLARSELTKAQRQKHLAAWAERLEKPSEPRTVSKGGRGKKGGVRDAARRMGVPSSTVHDAIKATATSPEPAPHRPKPAPAILNDIETGKQCRAAVIKTGGAARKAVLAIASINVESVCAVAGAERAQFLYEARAAARHLDDLIARLAAGQEPAA